MSDTNASLIDVHLHGGPAYFPPERRSHRAHADQLPIKVEYYGGYEHFERSTPPGESTSPVVFAWIRRTTIAE